VHSVCQNTCHLHVVAVTSSTLDLCIQFAFSMTSKGASCLGELPSKARCTLGKGGNPIFIPGRCKRCTEKRCRTHCKCGRKGTAKGRSAGRPKPTAKAKARAGPRNPDPPAVARSAPAPSPRPPMMPTVAVYPRNMWQPKALEQVRFAEEVLYATYLYDDPYFHNVFLERLRSRGRFHLHLLVDQQAYQESVCKREHGKLLALK
jgi:hypothetical protein